MNHKQKERPRNNLSLASIITVLILLLTLSANEARAYSGYVGEQFHLSSPSAPGVIMNMSWFCYDHGVDVSGGSWGATVTITSYFSGTATVDCSYVYRYYDSAKGRYTYSNVEHAYYYITCKASSMTLSQRQVTLKPGETVKLSYENSVNYEPPSVVWTTSNLFVASFDGFDTVTQKRTVTVKAEGVGECVITCDGHTGYDAPTCTIIVKGDPPTDISLPATATTQVGESVVLTPTLSPSDAYTTITWKSGDETVATVSGGKVSGKNVGKTTITATTDNGLSATCEVTVEKTSVKISADAESGIYATGKTVTLKASRTDAEIYYSLDGSTPTTSSTRYTEPITLNKSVTLKAIATGSNYVTSDVLMRQYTITSLAVQSSWQEDEAQTPYFIPTVTFSKAISPNKLNVVCLTRNNDTISGQALVQEGILYFVPDEPLSAGSYTLTIPENAVIDANGEPNLTIKIKLIIEYGMDGPVIAQTVAGDQHSLAIKTDGTLWAWGDNGYGRLGDGTYTDRTKPIKILDDVVMAAAGDHSLAIKTDGTLWAWGSNLGGQLGDGTTTTRTKPVKVMDDVALVAAGDTHSLAIKSDGTLWAWGGNHYGQLGDGTKTDRTMPVKVLEDVVQVAACYGHSLAIKTDGTLWAWGRNEDGQLGDGTYTARTKPVKVLDDVVQATAGEYLSLAIKTDGTLWSWGSNEYGQLGDGTTTARTNPVKVMDDVVQVATGGVHSLAIKADGTLWAWGSNTFGRLGDSTTTARTMPVKVLDDVVQVEAGYNHSLAIKTDGTLWAWGRNEYGQLGDGTTTDRLSPVYVMGKLVFSPVTSITLSQASLQLLVGEKCLVTPTIAPADGCIAMLSYESSNTQVATVTQRGIVEAKGVGTANITVTVDSAYTATLTLQVQERTMSVTTSSAGYATFYDSQSAFMLPNGLTAQVVSNASDGKLTYQPLSGGVIPQDVAVMLTADNKQTATYTLTRTENGGTYSGINLLHGSDEATTTTGDGKHYKLAYGPSGTNLKGIYGWYWGSADGAPFKIEGHKAWLVLPTAQGARTRGYSVDGEALGIDNMEADDGYSVYFDLQGRRVSQPTKKGIYIKNGKKVINH